MVAQERHIQLAGTVLKNESQGQISTEFEQFTTQLANA